MPISDGGDGFVDCMSYAFKSNPFVELHTQEVLDPIKRPVRGQYLINRETKTAYVEVANVSGLELITKE